MKKFKVGDKVRRTGDTVRQVVNGNTYIVRKVDKFLDEIDLEGLQDFGYEPRYFELVEEPQYPNPPHKHHDLIIAWANGADIEFYSYLSKAWLPMNNPIWATDTEYRIRPTKSAEDVEIESIQAEMAKLQERIEKLKEGK